ncbi:MAG: phytoene desaturase family protein [Promethearchaeota archaeon]
MSRISIIGAGLAGLTAGAFLARNGHQVQIFEQFSDIGGVAATIEQDGYKWDIGPLLLEGLGPNEPIRIILEELDLMKKLRIVNEDRGLSTPDFTFWRPEKYQGLYWRREMLKNIFPEESINLNRYFKFYLRMIKLVTIFKQSDQAKGFRKFLLKVQLLFTALPIKKMQEWNATQLLDYFFSNDKIKGLFAGILADFVIRPSEFQGVGIPMVNIETAFDKRIPINIDKHIIQPQYNYILGGCGEMVKLLANFIKKHNGTIQIQSEVQKILFENNQAIGIELENGEQIFSDIVLATGDIQSTFYNLVGKEQISSEIQQHINSLKYMESVFMVHIGIDFDPSPYQPAALCYYYGTYDIENAVKKIRNGIYHEGKDGYLIYIPSMHSPEMAPPHHHAVTVYTVAPNHIKDGDWQTQREKLADKLLEYAESKIPGLREHTKTRLIMTPEDFRQRIQVKHHSFGGIPPIMGQKGFDHQTSIKNLFYAGCQSESTGGIANTMNGGKKVAHLILSSLKEDISKIE